MLTWKDGPQMSIISSSFLGCAVSAGLVVFWVSLQLKFQFVQELNN